MFDIPRRMTILQRVLAASSLATIVKAFVVPRQTRVDKESGSFSPPEEEDPELLAYIDRWIDGDDDDEPDIGTTEMVLPRKKQCGSIDITKNARTDERQTATATTSRHPWQQRITTPSGSGQVVCPALDNYEHNKRARSHPLRVR